MSLIDPDELQRLLKQESGNRDFDSKTGKPVTSPKGAKYAMQVMPGTARAPGFGIKPAESDSPEEYNRVGREYFEALLQKYGDHAKAIAAYNTGPDNVDKAVSRHGDEWLRHLASETQAYVPNILEGKPQAPAGSIEETTMERMKQLREAEQLKAARGMTADAKGGVVPLLDEGEPAAGGESISDRMTRLRAVMAEPDEPISDSLAELRLSMKENTVEAHMHELRKSMAEAGQAEPEAPPEHPMDEAQDSFSENHPWLELGADLAMWGAAGLASAAVVGMTAPVSLPALGATALTAAGTVGIHAGVKALWNKMLSNPQDDYSHGGLLTMLTGELPGPLNYVDSIGEELLFSGLGGGLYKAMKGSVVPVSRMGKVLNGVETMFHKPMDWVSEKAWKPLGEAFWDNVVVGQRSPLNLKVFTGKWSALGEDAGKVSLRELAQPAVDRLAQAMRPEAGTFRRGLAMKDLVTQIGRSNIGPEFEMLMPSEKTDFLRLLSGAKPDVIASEDAKLLHSKWKGLVGEAKTEPFFKQVMTDELSKGVNKRLFETEAAAGTDLGEIEDVLKLYEANFGEVRGTKTAKGKWKDASGRRKDVNKILENAMEHPDLSDEARTWLKDLRMMNTRVPLEIADASRKASTAFLVNKLKRMPGTVVEPHVKSKFFVGQRLPESVEASLVKALKEGRPKLKRRMEQVLGSKTLLKGEDWVPEGYIKSNYGKFKGQYLHRDVELELEAIARVPEIGKNAYTKYFLSPFKASATVLRPGYHVVVNLGNLVLNDWGGLPFYRTDVYMDAIKGMRGKSKEWADFARITGAGGSWIQSDIYQLAEGMQYGAGMIDKMYNTFQKVVQPASSFSQSSMNMFKFAKYLHNTRELGMSASEAAWDAQKWICHFGETTPAVAKLATSAIGAPFARWESRILPLMAETAVKHPMRFGKWMMFGQALQAEGLESVGMTPEEWEDTKKMMPEYLRGGGFLVMPWRDDKGKLNLLNASHLIPGLPQLAHYTQAVGNILTGEPGKGIVDMGKAAFQEATSNPFFNIGASFATGRKHSGAPLFYEWEEPSMKAGKTFAYAWESLVPGLMPGGLDFGKIWNSFSNDPNALSPEQAVASSLGFRLTAVNEVDLAQRQMALRRIHEAEMKGQMRKEIRAANSEEEVNNILERYQKLREGLD